MADQKNTQNRSFYLSKNLLGNILAAEMVVLADTITKKTPNMHTSLK